MIQLIQPTFPKHQLQTKTALDAEVMKELKYVVFPFKGFSLFCKDSSSTVYVSDAVLGTVENFKWLQYCLYSQGTY